jgi:hypothetical protein
MSTFTYEVPLIDWIEGDDYYAWFAVHENLYVETVAEFGETPDWFEEYEESGVGDSFYIEAIGAVNEGMCCKTIEEAMLIRGLAWGQPFLMRFSKPTYSGFETMDGMEYDCDLDCEFIRMLPRPIESSFESTVELINDMLVGAAEDRIGKVDREQDRLAAILEGAIRFEYRATFGREQSPSDSMEMPNSLCYTAFVKVTPRQKKPYHNDAPQEVPFEHFTAAPGPYSEANLNVLKMRISVKYGTAWDNLKDIKASYRW